jgi:hypothetical protein
MAQATNAIGALQELKKCYILTPWGKIVLKILPEITDSKGASYSPENIQGRASPIINYSHSEANTISTELTFIITTCQDIQDNLTYLNMIRSLVYPGPAASGAPYSPPPISKFVCGSMFGKGQGLCVILKSYSYRAAADVPWDMDTYLPYKFTVSCQWEVVYPCRSLPTSQSIRLVGKQWPITCPSSNRVDGLPIVIQ